MCLLARDSAYMLGTFTVDLLTSVEQLESDSFDTSRSYTDRRRSFAQLWQKILEIRQIGDQKLELTSAMLETVRVIIRRWFYIIITIG